MATPTPRPARRQFFAWTAAATVLASCSGAEGQGGEPNETKPRKLGEPPALADQVTDGTLPPMAERLPEQPYVVEPGTLVPEEFVPLEQGKYGGRLELAQESPTRDPVIFVGINEPLLWSPGGFGYADGQSIEGNVVEGWEANADSTRFTFFLRRGLRWSDGEPVTIDDVRFAIDDVVHNPDITAAVPVYLRSAQQPDGAPVALEVVDDWTFILGFDRPYGNFPVELVVGQWRSYVDIIKPRHYLEQFHATYADPTQLRATLREESFGAEEWYNLFNAKQLADNLSQATTEEAIGHPVLTPWALTKASSGTFTYERNPYYFKVDGAGNQLPYIDELRSQVVPDKETLTSRALFGDFDYLGERASLRQLSLIAEKAETGEVQMFVPRLHTINNTVFLNLTHPDETWRSLVRNVDVRRALSLAIDRDEIIENFYLGEFAEPTERVQSGEHDPDEAERLLDAAGLDQRDSDGFRLDPAGQRFTIPFELANHTEDMIPIGELIAEHWRNVGIHTTIKTIGIPLFGDRVASNELQATLEWVALQQWESAAKNHYLPMGTWAPLWQQWFDSSGRIGEEPPAEIRQLYEAHSTLMAAPFGSPDSQQALESIIENHRDNIWFFLPFEEAYFPTFFTNRLHNVPSGIKQDVFGIMVSYSMEQWYIDE